MGVWIETFVHVFNMSSITVAPHVGVWIETTRHGLSTRCRTSRPTWACGLKQVLHSDFQLQNQVAPYVGVWIETP